LLIFLFGKRDFASFIKMDAEILTGKKMIHVSVRISDVSTQKFWEEGKPAPPGLSISTNVNIQDVKQSGEALVVLFVVTISYMPSFAHISFKGQAIVSGEKAELERLQNDYKNQRAPPSPQTPMSDQQKQLLQSIMHFSLIKATMLSEMLNIPPPIPLPSLPPQQQKPEKGERPSYVG